MKREITFRAWDTITENYYYNVQDTHDANIGDSFGGILNNGELVIEQYTGLHDRNGKPIYEGDIVKVVSQYWGQLGNRYEVKFKQGAFCAKYGLLSEISRSTLVIGNVHTNPELLEEEK